MLADPVLLDPGRAFVPEGALDVLREVGNATQQVATVLLHRLLDQLRVGRQVIVRRQDLQSLAEREAHASFGVGVHARHIAHGLARHARDRQERLREQVEGKLAPLGPAEARRVRRTLGVGRPPAKCAAGELRHRDRLGEHLPREFCLAAGRGGEASKDREPGAGKRLRGHATGHVRHHGERPARQIVRLLHRFPRPRLSQCKMFPEV